MLRVIGILAIVAAVLAAAVGASALYFGAYNVAATEPHWRITVRMLDTAMRGSVRQRVEELTVPPLDGETRLVEGAAAYRTHCETCHGAPGVAPQPFALGMVPLPASLVYTAREWPPADLFWVIKHGIKMTGMPAWEFRLSDEQIWSVVAFLSAMARMTPLQYAELKTPEAYGHEKPRSVGDTPNQERGKRAIHQYGCPTCHLIPGISASSAPVGPPLESMARRQYIAGVLPNTRPNMVRWLRGPRQVDPRSAMPDLGVSERDAIDIAAYLATLD